MIMSGEYISVDDALSKGHRMVTFPRIGAYLVTALATFLVVYFTQDIFFLGLGTVLAFTLESVVQGVQIPRWSLWAFSGVRNVHELRRRAISEGIIPSEARARWTLEIWTNNQRKTWNRLQQKFNDGDLFIDDRSVPAETRIFFHKVTSIYDVVMLILLCILGVYVVYQERYGLGVFLLGYTIYSCITIVRERVDFRPQIVLSNEGLRTAQSGFYRWEDVHDEGIVPNGDPDSSDDFLCFRHGDVEEMINLKKLDTTGHELENLLLVYRSRNKYGKSVAQA